MHQHQHQHHTHEPDWDAMADHLEREAELHLTFLEQAADWLVRVRGDADGVRRLLDVGSGPGVATCVLARAFPNAEAVAVDGAPKLLERAETRAAGQELSGRVVTRQADLPGELGALGSADLVWTSNVVHHFGDQQAALDGLAARIRPGGVLAVVERGLLPRYLPRDIGIGRPGLLARLEAAQEDFFSEMRAELPGSVTAVEDWPGMLAGSGLVPSGSRTFLTDLLAPLGLPAREHLHAQLTRLRHRLDDRTDSRLDGRLDAEDRLTLDRLLDGDDRTGILQRPDAFYLAATTVHTARARRDGGADGGRDGAAAG